MLRRESLLTSPGEAMKQSLSGQKKTTQAVKKDGTSQSFSKLISNP